MSVGKVERDARTLLIAMYRTYRREGIRSLTPDEIAGRAGYQTKRLDTTALSLLLEKGWAVNRGEELELTDAGLEQAQHLLYS